VTYVKAFDLIREVFARTPEAVKASSAGHFSFNIPGGAARRAKATEP